MTYKPYHYHLLMMTVHAVAVMVLSFVCDRADIQPIVFLLWGWCCARILHFAHRYRDEKDRSARIVERAMEHARREEEEGT